jgi:hypothetical protein
VVTTLTSNMIGCTPKTLAKFLHNFP